MRTANLALVAVSCFAVVCKRAPEQAASALHDVRSPMDAGRGSSLPLRPVAEPRLVPLERLESRGLRPSQQVGQTIVLPADTELRPGDEPLLTLRSNPRGHAFGELDPVGNRVEVPAWAIVRRASHVAFRASDPALARQAAWDVWVACRRRELVRDDGTKVIELTPADASVSFSDLTSRYDLDPTPYLPAEDFAFVAKIGRATSPDASLGEHLAAYEPKRADPDLAPPLHEFFRTGFRGPYRGRAGSRPPWAYISVEAFAPAIGETVSLRLPSDPRGHAVLRLDASGRLEGPPWELLLETKQLAMRHADDPSADIRFDVRARLDGARIVFEHVGASIDDVRRWLADGYLGPFAVLPDYVFEAAVRDADANGLEFGDRRALVPVHRLGEPHERVPGELPYAPHPGALADAGWGAPVLDAPRPR